MRTTMVLYLLQTLIIVFITVLQVKDIVHVDLSERLYLNLFDSVIFSALVGIIVAISWLSNREIVRSLEKSLKSEEKTKKYAKALEKQKDILEVRVLERTKKLEDTQKRRFLEMKNFVNIGKIASGLMHDIANPLTIGLARADELDEYINKVRAAKPAKESIGSIRSIMDKLRVLTLNTKKQIMQQSNKVYFDPVDEVEEVIELLDYKTLKENVEIFLKPSSGIKFYGDQIKFSQIVLNIILNAIESYTKQRKKSKKQIIIDFKETDKQIEVTIQDFGVGIPKKNFGKIFEPLFSTKKGEGSLGLGLYMTAEYVKEYGGRIDVESKEGKGTKFIIKLPKVRRN